MRWKESVFHGERVVERRIPDRKVVGLIPGRIRWEDFLLQSQNSLCWLLFRYPFHPCVTYVVLAHVKDPGYCVKRRWQETLTHPMCVASNKVTLWTGACLYGAHSVRRGGRSFTWHQPCNNQTALCITTSVDIQKGAVWNQLLMQSRTHLERSGSARKQRTYLCIGRFRRGC